MPTTTTDDSAADRPGDATDRRRRHWSIALAVSMFLGAALSLAGPVVTVNAVATAVICGACGVIALASAVRGR